ncbi:hypothetical protein [Leptospira interrogans]|nr:hypothetical protein [Leptospira interrogans]AKP27772.1 hypothetical protein LIMLP_10005 [Leptospira interrogans serovar Manilae]AKP31546.1 hypothetical protein LIMHP_10010 [Leptospira interrogans serovar Manilae]EYU63545.1 hypothetical protein CI00_13395 [Leptospira interrogans serovar Manilae]
MEFMGGTYCSQVKAKDLKTALNSWTQILTRDRLEIKHLTLNKLKRLEKKIQDGERPTKLKGLKNIWFTSFLTKENIIHVNIIKTASR